MIEELIARVFATRNYLHIAHWSTKSYAQHVALGDLYGALVDDLDGIVELYQGAFEKVSLKKLPEQVQPKDIISHLEDDLLWIGQHRQKITQGISAIDNLIQGMEGSYLSALYKLKNLE